MRTRTTRVVTSGLRSCSGPAALAALLLLATATDPDRPDTLAREPARNASVAMRFSVEAANWASSLPYPSPCPLPEAERGNAHKLAIVDRYFQTPSPFRGGGRGRGNAGQSEETALIGQRSRSGTRNGDVTVAVTAPRRECPETPVSITIPASREYVGVTVKRGADVVPSQVRRDGDQLEVTWIARELQPGAATDYRLTLETRAPSAARPGVTVARNGDNLDLQIDGALFTRYDTTTGPNKPYFYPLIGPGGRRLTRRYPIEPATGETRDHPHHRGLWFTHGAVNGGDYWVEGPNTAKTVHRKYERIEGGPVYGAFRALTDWIGRDGKKVCEDVRDVRVYNTPSGRLLDFAITLRATEGPLTFGDTKEGAFGLRLADTMRVKGGGGHIETSTGLKDAEAWGKRAAWVDYYGPVDGAVVGVAIFDHPTNFRHPTWWHVRDYGLFAANPFGIHDFEPNRSAGAGDQTLPAGGALTFRYRLYLHAGTTSEARVAGHWDAYAATPTLRAGPGVEVR